MKPDTIIDPIEQTDSNGSIWEVLKVATKLGLTSFGGPIAHLGYFREEYVKRRKWINEQSYADLVALCQFLPGPASSQVGISIGIERAGILGGIAAWVGFTLPSAIALLIFAMVLHGMNLQNAGWLHGLMIVAVAVVAQAVWGMASKLANQPSTGTIAILAAILTLLIPSAYIQVIAIVLGGFFGWKFFSRDANVVNSQLRIPIRRKTGIVAWILFFGLLIGLPLVSPIFHSKWLDMFSGFYRAGSLVFGGGHVVLPLLQQVVVPMGWMTNSQFLAGYGAAQAVPGPLFTFSSYLGAVTFPSSYGVLGALVALVAMFLPAFLLVIGALPFWNAIRGKSGFQSALKGVNAAVVGILVSALYNPVWTSAIKSSADFGLAFAAFGLLMLWKLPPWIVVLFSALGGAVISAFFK